MNKISKAHFQFLEELKKNNNRPWFTERKPHFDQLYKAVKETFGEIYQKMLQTDDLDEFHVHRIYRNLRFSKDKTPYKLHFALYLGRRKPLLRGGYYVRIIPGGSYVGGGFWRPESKDLLRIRQEIDMDPEPLRKILADKTLKKYFGELKGEELKTAPRGFDIESPAIDLLRKKQFLLTRYFTDKEMLSPDFPEEAVKTMQSLRPFFDYMSEVLTTDENGVSLYD